MLSLGIDIETHDLDFTVADGLDSIEQRVIMRLRFFRNTWFLDFLDGIPYLDDVFISDANADIAANVLATAARGVDGVTDVTRSELRIGPLDRPELSREPRLARRAYVELDIVTEEGEATMTVAI